MVSLLDGLVGIGGDTGAQQQIALALALTKPLLPVPCFGGASQDIWKDHESYFKDDLGLSEQEASMFTVPPKDEAEAKSLSYAMIKRFLQSLPHQVFVSMPFGVDFDPLLKDIIEPAINLLGDACIRVDRLGMPGDAVTQIYEGIKKSSYVVAVLTGGRPNVYHEVGYAEALGKPIIFMCDRVEIPQFNISTRQCILYDRSDMNSLAPTLQRYVKGARELAKT